MDRDILFDMYVNKKLSMKEISMCVGRSVNGVVYWMEKYSIPRRSISEAVYLHKNPNGDPFIARLPKNVKEGILYGMGLGLFRGEGNKANKVSLRIGNSDPKLILKFIEFLEKFYCINRHSLRFSLQIFEDLDSKATLSRWTKELGVSESQFSKTTISKKRGSGTYRKKSHMGVLTLYFHNRKLRDLICKSAGIAQ